jgi:hypothetical protein
MLQQWRSVQRHQAESGEHRLCYYDYISAFPYMGPCTQFLSQNRSKSWQLDAPILDPTIILIVHFRYIEMAAVSFQILQTSMLHTGEPGQITSRDHFLPVKVLDDSMAPSHGCRVSSVL